MSEKNDRKSGGRHYISLPPYIVRLQKRKRRMLPATLPVLVALCDARDFETNEVSISMDDLCNASGVTDSRYVKPAIVELHELGILKTVRAGKPGRGNRAVWLINFDAEPWKENPAHGTGFKSNETPSQGTGFTPDAQAENTGPQDGFSGLNPGANPVLKPGANPGAKGGAKPGADVAPNKEFNYQESLSKTEDRAGFEEDVAELEARLTDPAGEPEGDPAQNGQRPPRREPVARPPADRRDVFMAAVKALDAWAMQTPPVGRGHVLALQHNEHRPLLKLLAELDTTPPIPRGDALVERRLLIPQAADALMKNNVEFKSTAWACGCIRNELRDWSNGSGTKGRPTKQAPKPYFVRRDE